MGNIIYADVKDNKIIKTYDQDGKDVEHPLEKYYENGFIEFEVNILKFVNKFKDSFDEDKWKDVVENLPVLVGLYSSVINKFFLTKKRAKNDDKPLEEPITFYIPLDIFDELKIDGIANEMKIDVKITSRLEFKTFKKILSLIKKDEFFTVRISNILGLFIEKLIELGQPIIKIFNDKDIKIENRLPKIIEIIFEKVYLDLLPTTCNYNLKNIDFLKFRNEGKDIDWCEKSTKPEECPPVKVCPPVRVCPPEKICPEPDYTIPYTVSGVFGILLVIFIILYLTK